MSFLTLYANWNPRWSCVTIQDFSHRIYVKRRDRAGPCPPVSGTRRLNGLLTSLHPLSDRDQPCPYDINSYDIGFSLFERYWYLWVNGVETINHEERIGVLTQTLSSLCLWRTYCIGKGFRVAVSLHSHHHWLHFRERFLALPRISIGGHL